MAMYQRTPLQGEAAQRIVDDASDQEEEAMVNDYREQVEFDDGLDGVSSERGGPMLNGASSAGGMPDMQANLMAAATPLEYQASLETKLASYDNYCNLFHFILNSDGPVDVDVPSVSASFCQNRIRVVDMLTFDPFASHSGPGTLSTNLSTNSSPSAASVTASHAPTLRPRTHCYCARTRTHGAATQS